MLRGHCCLKKFYQIDELINLLEARHAGAVQLKWVAINLGPNTSLVPLGSLMSEGWQIVASSCTYNPRSEAYIFFFVLTMPQL